MRHHVPMQNIPIILLMIVRYVNTPFLFLCHCTEYLTMNAFLNLCDTTRVYVTDTQQEQADDQIL